MRFDHYAFMQKIEELPASTLQTSIVTRAGELAAKYPWTDEDMKAAYKAGQAASEISATFRQNFGIWLRQYGVESETKEGALWTEYMKSRASVKSN
jgi:hypothetical protein